MKLLDINIRDPFIMPFNGLYYLYGTRSATCWGKAEGFDCYYSSDLDEWTGPIEIFHRPKDFLMDENYWAPECYFINGKFYLLTTFGGEHIKKGEYILVSNEPTGPFELYSDRLTPPEWTCIDGSLYQNEGHYYLIFSHSFEDGVFSGDLAYIELSQDLKKPKTKPRIMFSACDAFWTRPFPYAKQEFGIDETCYLSDGPFAVRDPKDNAIHLYWSSWGANGYAVGEAVSQSGCLDGPWIHKKDLIFPENGGHGMAFKSFDGQMLYTLHYPNDLYKEHPIYICID